ncbi:MAG: hypothetical protein MR014_05675 [Oscillospiraceae bacterium]|nr:hypothetical protein [Oscillospiraceae bacterium]
MDAFTESLAALDALFSRRARDIYEDLLSRTGSRSLAAELSREAFLRTRQAAEHLGAEALEEFLDQAVESAYLTHQDLSRIHDAVFPGQGGAPSAPSVSAAPGPEPAASETPDVFAAPSVSAAPAVPEVSSDHWAPESAPAAVFSGAGPAAPPETVAVPAFPEASSQPGPAPEHPPFLYDFQKEEVASYFANEPSAIMPPPRGKGSRRHGVGFFFVILFLVLFVLLSLWLLSGLLMSLGVIPFFDLGYLWFNKYLFRLF